jgi:hypothetical protein
VLCDKVGLENDSFWLLERRNNGLKTSPKPLALDWRLPRPGLEEEEVDVGEVKEEGPAKGALLLLGPLESCKLEAEGFRLL